MIKEEGHITYTIKDNPLPITKYVIYITRMGKCVEIYLDDDSLVSPAFLYDSSTNTWFVPSKDKYGEFAWKAFNGKVLSFEFRTYFEGN